MLLVLLLLLLLVVGIWCTYAMAKTTFKCTATSWSVRLCWALEMTKQLLLLLVQWVNSTVHCLCVSVNQLEKLFSLFQVHSLTYKQLL